MRTSLFAHRHRMKVIDHVRQDGPGTLVAGTYVHSIYTATFYVVMACDCGEVQWREYPMWQGVANGRAEKLRQQDVA